MPEDKVHRAHDTNPSSDTKCDIIQPQYGSLPEFGRRGFGCLNFPDRSIGKSAYAIFRLANQVFGFNGWSAQIKYVKPLDDIEHDEKQIHIFDACVCVKLKNGVIHDGFGVGENENTKTAYSSAVTSAFKDALSKFHVCFDTSDSKFDNIDFKVQFDQNKEIAQLKEIEIVPIPPQSTNITTNTAVKQKTATANTKPNSSHSDKSKTSIYSNQKHPVKTKQTNIPQPKHPTQPIQSKDKRSTIGDNDKPRKTQFTVDFGPRRPNAGDTLKVNNGKRPKLD